MIYAALGEKDKAFEWLEKAYEDRSITAGGPFSNIKVDPVFDPLRSGPALRRPAPPHEPAALKNINDPAFFKLFCIGSRKAMAVSSKTSSTNCDARFQSANNCNRA